MKKQKNKLFKISLGSLALISPIPLIFLNQENKITNGFSKIFNFKDNQEQNQQIKMSKNIGFPIFTVHKTGHDAERMNFLLIGEGYSKDEENKFFDHIKELGSYLMLTEPFKQFSHLMNFYAIFTHKDEENKSFLETYISNGIYRMSQKGKIKLSNLVNTFENSFLEEGGKIADISIVNAAPGTGSAYQWTQTYDNGPNSWLNFIDGSLENTKNIYVHETGHSFGNLTDEYPGGGVYTWWPNAASSHDEAKRKWGEFIGFKNIGIYSVNSNAYKPSETCMMNSSTGNFCEVCAYHLFLRLNNLVPKKEQKDIYLATSSISLERTSGKYEELGLEAGVTTPLSSANGKKIDFSTMVHNFRKTSRKIKLKMWIEDKTTKAVKKEWTQEFDIQPNELKKITILTEAVNGDLANENNSIHGQVIDAETNNVLETRKSYLKRFLDYGEVKLNFKLFENGQMSNKDISSVLGKYKFSVENNTKYKITPPILRGYRFKQSDKTELEIKNDLSQISPTIHEATLYYEKLPSKKFKTQLKSELGIVVQTKEQTIYENEVFIPGIYDFFMTWNNGLIDFKKSIPEIDKSWSYNDIQEGTTIIYNMIPDPAPMYEKNEVILDYGTTWNPDGYKYNYGYDWEIKRNNTESIQGDSINTSIPGIYYLTFTSNPKTTSFDNVSIIGKRDRMLKVIVKKQDGSLPDESSIDIQLKNEKTRIDNKYLYLRRWRYSNEQINKLTTENIFSEYIYGMAKKDGFYYKAINLDKSENNKIKFNIEITKNSKNKQSTIQSRQIVLYYKIGDYGPTPEIIELETEKTRVNNLNLSFAKEEYTKQEMDQINISNFLTSFIGNWAPSPGFQYEIIDLSNDQSNNKYNFKIKITKGSSSVDSKLFEVGYKLIENPNPVDVELEKEKERVNNLTLTFKKEEYSQEEINSFNSITIKDQLNNWPSAFGFNYEVINLSNDQANKKFAFTIKITKDSQSTNSKLFEVVYKLTQPVDPIIVELEKEKEIVDNANLSLKNPEYTQQQIDEMNPSSLMNELINLNKKPEYMYEIVNLNKNIENKTISFKIRISKDGKQVESKDIHLTYKLISNDNNNNNNSNNNNLDDNLSTILLGTLIPISLVIVGVVGFVIYKKRKNN